MKNRTAFFKVSSGAVLLAALCGCAADNSKPELTESQKQDAALNNPGAYKPTIGNTSAGDDNITNTNGLGKDFHDLFLGP